MTTTPDERRLRMARLYFEDGLTCQQIGEEFGLSRQRVSQLISGFEGERHHGSSRRREEADRTLAAHERMAKGESTAHDEATKLGISKHALYNRFSRAGLLLPKPEQPGHGTVQCYWRGCRRSECREANRLHHRSNMTKEPPNHGTESGYRNYGCKCKPCKEAARVALRDRRQRRQKQREVVS